MKVCRQAEEQDTHSVQTLRAEVVPHPENHLLQLWLPFSTHSQM